MWKIIKMAIMKVLLIMNNSLSVKDDKIYTDNNTYHIIKRFSYLGKITVCAPEYSPKRNIYAKQDVCVDFLTKDDVAFVQKSRMFPDLKIARILDAQVKKTDLVIAYQGPCVNAETALYYSRKYNKKYMSYVVACAWDGFWNHGVLGKMCALYRYLALKAVVKLSDYALYVSDEFLQGRYPNDKMNIGCSDVVITTGDAAVLERRKERIGSRLPGDIIKMATVAAVNVKYKGQQYAIEALGRLKREGIENIHYYLIGGGSTEYLSEKARRFGVSEQVHFVGAVPHGELMGMLDNMDIYIQPSSQEGLPRSVVEAMSRGLACYGSKTGGIPELLDSGFIFKKRSVGQIVRCLKSITTAIMQEQAVRNINKATEYNSSVLVAKRKAFFDAVINDVKSKA